MILEARNKLDYINRRPILMQISLVCHPWPLHQFLPGPKILFNSILGLASHIYLSTSQRTTRPKLQVPRPAI